MKKSFKALLILLSILLITSVTYSAEKGTLKIIVVDDEGNVLPGVSMTVSPCHDGIKDINHKRGRRSFVC
jgi:hypothetical protein